MFPGQTQSWPILTLTLSRRINIMGVPEKTQFWPLIFMPDHTWDTQTHQGKQLCQVILKIFLFMTKLRVWTNIINFKIRPVSLTTLLRHNCDSSVWHSISSMLIFVPSNFKIQTSIRKWESEQTQTWSILTSDL